MPVQESKTTQEADLRHVIANLYQAALEPPEMTLDKLKVILGVSKKTIQRTAAGQRDVTVREFLVFQAEFPSICKPLNILLETLPEDTAGQSEVKTKLPNEIKAAPLDLPYSRWAKSHFKLARRFGPRAIKPDKWREARDWTLAVALFYSFIKILNVWFGFHFGLSNDYSDPTLLVSICIILMFGYAFLEDLLRKRYFIGAPDD